MLDKHLKDAFNLDDSSFSVAGVNSLRLSNILVTLLPWISEVCDKFKLSHATYFRFIPFLYITLNKMNGHIEREQVQKFGSACLLMANKLEGLYDLIDLKDMVYISDNSFNADELRQAEFEALVKLDFKLYQYQSLYDVYDCHVADKLTESNTWLERQQFLGVMSTLTYFYQHAQFKATHLVGIIGFILHQDDFGLLSGCAEEALPELRQAYRLVESVVAHTGSFQLKNAQEGTCRFLAPNRHFMNMEKPQLIELHNNIEKALATPEQQPLSPATEASFIALINSPQQVPYRGQADRAYHNLSLEFSGNYGAFFSVGSNSVSPSSAESVCDKDDSPHQSSRSSISTTQTCAPIESKPSNPIELACDHAEEHTSAQPYGQKRKLRSRRVATTKLSSQSLNGIKSAKRSKTKSSENYREKLRSYNAPGKPEDREDASPKIR